MIYNMNYNRFFNKTLRYDKGGGAGGGSSSACIEAITADSNPDDFLKAEDIESACSAVTDMKPIFGGIEDSFRAIEKESETAFSVDSAFPIEDRSININRSISSIGERVVNHSSEIKSEGEAHRRAEAAKYYIKVKERLVEYNEDVHSAVTNYNSLVDQKKADYMSNPTGEKTDSGDDIYPTQSQADAMYGGHIRVSPDAPYESSLDTTIHIESNCNYHSDIDGGKFIEALKKYNDCASDKGAKAEKLKQETEFEGGDVSSVTYGSCSTYDSVSATEAGINYRAYTKYSQDHDNPLDLHYYGTVKVTDPKTGETTRQPVYYDANDHHGTYTGGFIQSDSARLMIIVDGVPCYLTNYQQTRSHDDTRPVDGELEYNVSILTDEDNGTPVALPYGDPVEQPGSVYANHDNPDSITFGPGGWSDDLYIKDAEGNTYNVDWSSAKYSSNDEDDKAA